MPDAMSRVLLDENMPLGLRTLLRKHEVSHVIQLGWDGIENGELIAVAEQAGYEVLVTGDKNLRYQQNMTKRELALVILGTNRWTLIRSSPDVILRAIDDATSGSFVEVDLGNPELR